MDASSPRDDRITAAPLGSGKAERAEAPRAGGGSPSRGRLLLRLVLLAAFLAAGLAGWQWWSVWRHLVSTDNAYVRADLTRLSPEIPGRVAAILVAENAEVEAGAPVLRLEDRDQRIALRRAEALLAKARAGQDLLEARIVAARAAVGQAQAALEAARARLANAESYHERVSSLTAEGFNPQARLDDAEARLREARAGVRSAEAGLAAARAQLAVLETRRAEISAAVAEAEAARDAARLALERTVVRAAVAGTVTHVAPSVGDVVAAGRQIATIVPRDTLHVEANFKETVTARLAPGQEVELTFDALPGRRFRGRVESLAPATGAEFAILPPQNATGNFTRIVQWVPVRIALPPEALAEPALRSGISAVATVDTRTTPERSGREAR